MSNKRKPDHRGAPADLVVTDEAALPTAPRMIPATSYDWGKFVTEGYPMVGEPSTIRPYDPAVERGFFVSIWALLSYDDRGYLQGALMFFPHGSPVDRPGNVSVIVRPNARRRGVATALLAEAARQEWPIDVTVQDYTPEGWALLNSFAQELEEAEEES